MNSITFVRFVDVTVRNETSSARANDERRTQGRKYRFIADHPGRARRS
jgi:hypothetical protein